MLNRIMLYFLCAAGLLMTPFCLPAQCFRGNTAIGPGEYLAYDVSYQVGPVWSNVASFTMSTVRETAGGSGVLHLKLNVRTYPMYDHLFKVRDSYESWVNEATWAPVKFQRYTMHNQNTVLMTLFMYPVQSFFTYNYKLNNEPVSNGKGSIAKCMNDMVSSVFFPRTLELENQRPGTVFPLSILYNDQPTSLRMVAGGKGIIKDRDGKMYHCSKFIVKMNATVSYFKEGSDVVVWMTADKNKLPVYVEAELKVGTVKIYLKEARGLRNPMTALLSK